MNSFCMLSRSFLFVGRREALIRIMCIFFLEKGLDLREIFQDCVIEIRLRLLDPLRFHEQLSGTTSILNIVV